MSLGNTSSLNHHLQWVKVHQGWKKPCEELGVWGRVSCDRLATSFRLRMEAGDEVRPIKEGFFELTVSASLLIKGTHINSHCMHKT